MLVLPAYLLQVLCALGDDGAQTFAVDVVPPHVLARHVLHVLPQAPDADPLPVVGQALPSLRVGRQNEVVPAQKGRVRMWSS
jgi:hypothetical protein